MKIKIACILLLGMCMIGCNRTTDATTMVEDLNMPHEESVISQSHLKIINEVSIVKRGETGVITIQGTQIGRAHV